MGNMFKLKAMLQMLVILVVAFSITSKGASLSTLQKDKLCLEMIDCRDNRFYGSYWCLNTDNIDEDGRKWAPYKNETVYHSRLCELRQPNAPTYGNLPIRDHPLSRYCHYFSDLFIGIKCN